MRAAPSTNQQHVQSVRTDGMDKRSSPEKSWHHQVMDFDFTLAIDIPDLAAAIGANPRSARNAFYLRPQDFPPAIYLPGCRGPRFMVSDVLTWLESRKTPAPPPPPVTPKPQGRPRKASPAQIARASQGKGGAA